MNLKVQDKVSYWDGRTTRTGEIIEMNTDNTRARIRWDDNRPRTWIRVTALTKIGGNNATEQTT
jgi:hypothetical protein